MSTFVLFITIGDKKTHSLLQNVKPVAHHVVIGQVRLVLYTPDPKEWYFNMMEEKLHTFQKEIKSYGAGCACNSFNISKMISAASKADS